MADDLVLEMRDIRKEFPGVVANDRVSFDVRRGEVHALLGENGAGKSTLMNILYGLYRPDGGEIRLNGKPVSFASARDAIQAGIGMVHQHFMLIPVMTVAENIVLGSEPVREGIFLDEAAADRRVTEMAKTFRFEVDPDARVEDIGVGQQQRVEIMKALYRNADILILDEPTAVLTPQEATDLFEILRTLQREGMSIIFISHKLNEVLEIADRITVLRRGKTIETVQREGATEESLAKAMVGREVLLRVEKAPANPSDVLLEVRDLHVSDERGIEKVRGVSFDVRAGEIVGIAGVDGNGQTELIDALTGLLKIESGTATIAGRELAHANARDALDAGIGHIPEDRQRRGLVLEFSIAENIALHHYAEPPDARFGWLFPGRMISRARTLIREFDVRGGGPLTRAGSLSGGNQQKVIAAREIARDPKLLIAAQPTRGVDVGSTEFIHARVVRERDQGAAVLLVSSELDEILALADRIAVIYRGRILATLPPDAAREDIGLLMAGVTG